MYDYPKIKNDQIFELLSKDILEIKLSCRISSYGRNGQNQNGIDLYTDGTRRVVQCKDYLKEKSAKKVKKVLLEELNKTKNLPFRFEEFWFATALDRDVNIQNVVEEINESSKLHIYILFWDDIEEILSWHTELAQKYYPSFRNQNYNVRSLISLGFFSCILSELIELMSSEGNVICSYCDEIENGLVWVNNVNTKDSLKAHLDGVRSYFNGKLDSEKYNLGDVCQWGKIIENNIWSINNSLEPIYSPYFIIGALLSIYHDHDLGDDYMTSPENIEWLSKLKFEIDKLNITQDRKNYIWSYIKKHKYNKKCSNCAWAIYGFLIKTL